jgi:hypothetical protein
MIKFDSQKSDWLRRRRRPRRRRPSRIPAAAPRVLALWFCLAFVELDANYIRCMNSVHIYVIRCMNSTYIYIISCMNSMYCWMWANADCVFFSKTECRLCFLLETECRFLSSSDRWADISLPVAIVAPISNERMMSAHPSLLGVTVVTGWLLPVATMLSL